MIDEGQWEGWLVVDRLEGSRQRLG